jgi:hypothetical protein
MRREVLAVIAMLSVLLATASVSESHARHNATAKCIPKRSQAVAADAQAEVYAVSHELQGHVRVSFGGCAYGSGRFYQLGHAIENGSIASRVFALAGPIVAYTTLAPPTASTPATLKVIVLNLSAGQMLHHESFPPVGEATSIVLKSDGSAAWLVPGSATDCVSLATPCYEVEDVEERGMGALLAKGSDIEPYSLALSGNTLYWTQGNRPASAILDCSPVKTCPLISHQGS